VPEVKVAAHCFTRYPDTATAFDGLKKKVAPGFNIILNGVEKEKVSVTGPMSVLVATKMWKALPVSPSPGSFITIDTPVVVLGEPVGEK
jgi:hypothetical protein